MPYVPGEWPRPRHARRRSLLGLQRHGLPEGVTDMPWIRNKHADALSKVVDRKLEERRNPPHQHAKAYTQEYTDGRGRRAWRAYCSCGAAL